MARKKEPPKPILALKHDFYASLDAHLHQSIMFLQAVELALDLGQVSDAGADVLRENVAEFRKTLTTFD